MSRANEILQNMDAERFAEILGASPKNFREELFRAAGVKAKTGTFAVHTPNKNLIKAKKLYASLKSGFEINDELSEELIRNYLFSRRSLLSDALDQLGVAHDQGLTDEDLDGLVEGLAPEKASALKERLCQNHEPSDVELYLKFMNFPGI